jgi:muramoyltetrapeptide carboxypeptidase
MVKNIRIISPSGAIDPEYIKGATERLLSLGFVVTEGRYSRGTCGRFAATDAERLQDMNEALADPTVDAILCARGGYGLQRIIDRVDEIRKPIIGFSDITELHQLAAIYGCPTLHSIMCKHLATLPTDSDPFQRTIEALQGKPLRYDLPAHRLNRCGEVTAPLIGGNLSVLYGLQGTPFGLQPSAFSHQKPILLIEDIGERHYHIDRMMNNLRMSGVLAQLSGLIVGQFTDCEDDPLMGETVYETIARYAAEYDYPVVFGFPVVHEEYNLPVWLNKTATLIVAPDHVQFRQI